MQVGKPTIIICIPAFNVEHTIASVIVKAQKHVYKIIVCDDGSKDMTAEIAEKLGAEVVRHERNMGYGAALATLFNKAREEKADVMVTMDGDGQHDPDHIPMLLEPIIRGEVDIVIGSRFLGESEGKVPGYRKAGIKVITKVTDSVSYEGLKDAQSGFRAYSRRALESIRVSEMGMGASTEIIMKASEANLKVKEVPIVILYSKDRPTQTPVLHGLDVILSTIKHLSIRHPLMFYGIPGFTSALIAVVFWIWTFETFAATRQLITNVTLIAVGTTVVGLLLITTAILLWILISVIRGRD